GPGCGLDDRLHHRCGRSGYLMTGDHHASVRWILGLQMKSFVLPREFYRLSRGRLLELWQLLPVLLVQRGHCHAFRAAPAPVRSDWNPRATPWWELWW